MTNRLQTVEFPPTIYYQKVYYVYIHITPSNKKYIGITRQVPKYRWKNGRGYDRNPHFYNAILSYGWENIQHIIIFDSLTVVEAKNIEIMMISLYNTTNREYGYNMMKGGDTGLAANMYTPERRQIMSNARKGKCMGYMHSSSKEVICLNTLERFGSCGLAAIKYNSTPNQISRCCRQYKYTCGEKDGIDLHWAYYDDYILMSEQQVNSILNRKLQSKKQQPVICVNTLEVFKYKKYVTDNYNIHLNDSSGISVSCKNNRFGDMIISSGNINGAPLFWMNYNDFYKLSYDKKNKLKELYYIDYQLPKKED